MVLGTAPDAAVQPRYDAPYQLVAVIIGRRLAALASTPAAERLRPMRLGFRDVVGLPDGVTACLFDLDGVLTQTAKVHAAAWKQMFDDYLRRRADQRGEEFVPFDPVDDYNKYVDGKPG